MNETTNTLPATPDTAGLIIENEHNSGKNGMNLFPCAQTGCLFRGGHVEWSEDEVVHKAFVDNNDFFRVEVEFDRAVGAWVTFAHLKDENEPTARKVRSLAQVLEHAEDLADGLNIDAADDGDYATYAGIGTSGSESVVYIHVSDDMDGTAIKFMRATEAVALAEQLIEAARTIDAMQVSN